MLHELSIQLLGGFRVHDNSGREIRIASRKGRALLAYLAVRAGESQARDRLAALLWEEADEELARTSLRQALASLRKALPAPAHAALRADTESVTLDAALVALDLADLRRALSSSSTTEVGTILHHYRGDLLEGLDARSAAFEEWLSHERLVLRRQVTQALQGLTALCRANDDVDGALAACTRLTSLEPLNEAAHRTLMELHAKRNAYAEALRQYRICLDTLRRELDVAPEPATEALYRELMRRRRAGTPTNEPDLHDGAAAETSAPQPSPSRDSRPALRDAVVSVARLENLLELEASADPEESLAVAQQFHTLVHDAACAFGGVADRRAGANILCVFGIPTAHGNEAERATRAALALRTAFAREHWPAHPQLKLRIGIAQGQVLPSADVFPLAGKPTHVAHALAAHAQDEQILIDDEVRQTLGDCIEARPLAIQTASTFEPYAAWSLTAFVSNAHSSERPFVGRRPELAMILAVLLKSRRRELHLRAAEWFRSRDLALHADHLAAADHESAAAAYAEAARAEQASLRFERAHALASKASAIARGPSLLHETSCQLGELSLQLGRTHDALTAYREALDFAIDQPGRGIAYFGIASALRIMDRYEEALDALDRAEQALGTNIEPHMKARLYSLRGNLCFPLGRVDACLEAHEQAQRFAEQAGTPLELARALGGIGDALYQRGRIVSAHRYFQRCVAEARRHELASVLIAYLPMLCVTHHFSCELREATQVYEEGFDLVRRVGDRRGELLMHLVASSTLLMRGAYEDCRRHAELAIQFSQRVGARRFHAEAQGLIARSYINEGQLDEALRHAEQGLSIARESCMSYCGPTLLGALARATNNPKQHAEALREGELLLHDGSVSHSHFEFYDNAIEVSMDKQMWTEARRYANALCKYTQDESVPWAELLVERAALLIAFGEGNATSARWSDWNPYSLAASGATRIR